MSAGNRIRVEPSLHSLEYILDDFIYNFEAQKNLWTGSETMIHQPDSVVFLLLNNKAKWTFVTTIDWFKKAFILVTKFVWKDLWRLKETCTGQTVWSRNRSGQDRVGGYLPFSSCGAFHSSFQPNPAHPTA